jgi:hypothetical protein
VSAITRRRPTTDAPGVRHGFVLALCVVVPATFGVVAATAARVEGFPVLGVVLLAAATTVVSGLLGVANPRPGPAGIGSRLVAAALVALGVRLTVPSPGQALAEVRERAAYLVSGTVLVVFVVLLLAAFVGHLITSRVVTFAEGRPTREAARAYDEQLLISAWGLTLTLVLIAGLTRRTGGATGQLLLLAALVVALVTIADLRSRIPVPGAVRAPIVAVSRPVVLVAAGLVTLVVVAVTTLALPVLPDALDEGLGRPSEWLADLEFDLDPDRAPTPSPVGEGDQLLDRLDDEARRLPPLPPLRDIVVADRVRWLTGVVLVLALLLVLRPDRWGPTLRRLFRTLRGGGWDDDTDGFETLEALEGGAGEEGDGPLGRFRDAFERVRPRPRDPRAAIVHDYLRVQRLLAREDAGRRPAETPLEHAARLRVAGSEVDLAPLSELAGLVSTARFGPDEPSPDAAARSRRLQERFEREFRARR